MGMRIIELDPELLHAAVVDGINRYVREVLKEQNLVDTEAMKVKREELLRLKSEIVNQIVEQYRRVETSE